MVRQFVLPRSRVLSCWVSQASPNLRANTAKLAAGSLAMLAGVDVNVAASSAGMAVENDSIFCSNFALTIAECLEMDAKQERDLQEAAEYVDKRFKNITIYSVSYKDKAYTIIVNNKNKKIYTSMIPDNSYGWLTPKSKAVGASMSHGYILGNKNADEIDQIIQGSSVSLQGCFGSCAGLSTTTNNDYTISIGLGTPGITVSKETMMDSGYTTDNIEISKLFE